MANDIEASHWPSTPDQPSARLCNFPTGKATPLRRAHQEWLSRHVVPILERPNQVLVEVGGLASRLGSDSFNEKLGQARADEVKRYLEEQLRKSVANVLTDSYGELVSGGPPDDNDGYYRAVLVKIHKGVTSLPPPPPHIRRQRVPKPPAPPVSRFFKLRLLGEISVSRAVRNVKLLKLKLGIGPGLDVIYFEIVDIINDRAAIYVFVGGNVQAGVYWLSSTHVGPWNYFSTSGPITVAQFEGFTRFSTLGAGCKSMNTLQMCGTPSGVDCVWDFINTGCTMGAAASIGVVGKMWLLEGPLPVPQGY